MEGEFRYLSGYSADTIMDNEAIKILWGYFENNYYNTSLTIEENDIKYILTNSR